MLLEFSQYLENYLWPNFDPKVARKAHVMSIVTMVNEKFSERVPAWEVSGQRVFSTMLQEHCTISHKPPGNRHAFCVIP